MLGEIDNGVISSAQRIKAIGEEAASQIQQQVISIRSQLDSLLEDAVKTGQAVGEMRRMAKKGEESEKSLSNFIREARARWGVKK